MKRIEVEIVKTSKGYHKSSKWTVYDKISKYFDTYQEMKEWLKMEYGDQKRSPMYVDSKDHKTTTKTGWVIGFRNRQVEGNGTMYNFLEQHWISVYEVEHNYLKVGEFKQNA